MPRWTCALACLAVALLVAGCEPVSNGLASKTADKRADADKPAESKSDAAKPPTHKVEKGPIKVEVSLKGVFESDDMTEVVLSPDAWTSSLSVVKAVEHGTPVRKGDLLLQLDLTKI